jgi:hypothetical protein
VGVYFLIRNFELYFFYDFRNIGERYDKVSKVLEQKIHDIEHLVKEAVSSEKMNSSISVKLAEREKKLRDEKSKYASSCQLIEEFKGKEGVLTGHMQKIEDYFTLKEKVTSTVLDETREEFSKILSFLPKKIMTPEQKKKKALFEQFTMFLRETMKENKAFFEKLSEECFHEFKHWKR